MAFFYAVKILTRGETEEVVYSILKGQLKLASLHGLGVGVIARVGNLLFGFSCESLVFFDKKAICSRRSLLN